MGFLIECARHDRPVGINTAIGRARSNACKRGETVNVITHDTDIIVAVVWPDGKVDVTWEGCRYA